MTLVTETTHAEKENAAYAAWMAAVRRQDHEEASRLWKEYTEIHKQRPPEVVRALEEAKGLR